MFYEKSFILEACILKMLGNCDSGKTYSTDLPVRSTDRCLSGSKYLNLLFWKLHFVTIYSMQNIQYAKFFCPSD